MVFCCCKTGSLSVAVQPKCLHSCLPSITNNRHEIHVSGYTVGVQTWVHFFREMHPSPAGRQVGWLRGVQPKVLPVHH